MKLILILALLAALLSGAYAAHEAIADMKHAVAVRAQRAA